MTDRHGSESDASIPDDAEQHVDPIEALALLTPPTAEQDESLPRAHDAGTL